MKRQAISDGRWFDLEKVETFKEDTWWNGNNHISRSTGSQWEHEQLYRTKGGKWILYSWSQYQGSAEHYDEIDNETAAAWIVRNNHEPHGSCVEEFNSLEIA